MVTAVDETPTIMIGPTEVDHDENDSSGTVDYVPAVATYTATDPEDNDSDLTWSLSGIDGSKFLINGSNGELTFMTPPDHEAPADSGRNNDYNVTVEATDSGGNTATRVVTVTVDNIDEPGVVTQSNLQPEDGKTIAASLTDPDGIVSGPTWQWATSSGQLTDPIVDDHIDDATSSTYKPVAGDVGDWLWAIASYTDGQGQDKTAMVVSGYDVRAADTLNELPMFPDQDDQTEERETDQTRTVAEDAAAGAIVGGVVTATDADTDARLTYSLGGDDAGSFAIDRKTGQITVGAETKLNFESKDTYVVMVTATDSHEQSETITVTITVTNVNESPELSKKALVVVGDERVDYLEGGNGRGRDLQGGRTGLPGGEVEPVRDRRQPLCAIERRSQLQVVTQLRGACRLRLRQRVQRDSAGFQRVPRRCEERDDQGHQQGRSGVLKPVVPAAGCRSRDYSHAKRP